MASDTHIAQINGYEIEFGEVQMAEIFFSETEFEMLKALNSKVYSVSMNGEEVDPKTLDNDTMDRLSKVMMGGLAQGRKNG